MGETSFKTIQLPKSVINQVDQAVKESEGFFSSRAELIKQATMRYIEELRKKNMILHSQFPNPNPNSDPLVTNGVTMGREFNQMHPMPTNNPSLFDSTQNYNFHIKSDKWDLMGTLSVIISVTYIKDKGKIKKVTAQKVIKINLKRFELVSQCIKRNTGSIGYNAPSDSVLVEQALMMTAMYLCERRPELTGKTRCEFILDTFGKNLSEGCLEFIGKFNTFRENGEPPCTHCHLKESNSAKTLINDS